MTVMLGLMLMLLQSAPGRVLYRDVSAQKEMVSQFIQAGEKHGVDPALLLWWSFCESSLRTDAVGAAGEVGLFQVHGKSRSICEKTGLNMDNQADQIECGALLFNMNRRYCGSIERGLNRYWCGACQCSKRIQEKVKWRLKKWKQLLSSSAQQE